MYKERYSNNYNNIYSFYFAIGDNGIEVNGAVIAVQVNKYTNEISDYSYSSRLNCFKIVGFDNTKSIDETEQNLKNNFDLEYVVNYNYDNKKVELILIYDPENYRLRCILKDNNYRDNEPITRGEAAVMLYRYLSSKNLHIKGIQSLKKF